ncbi:MAG: hypothetical protein ACD_30C00049G0030 [uncultured bacterium]|uniref:Uncharacterized protein n=4 Tax=Candidatus Daviesiibacteriota TaxID=1752718 RepID=A0A0G0HF04_9BACT|nr:MAG: hypothetical protein ACD_30C00049G0030 [uncultured bacterium]KKQ10674.1 MAG: hypothetical protein US19_C0001G0012 [Candidatus Daviesbacteria bacterium GW2011_GWB1_36_5]KKQ14996.1 MAG: hypothetical protein US28_C0025G0019 [Candidatus Daviesbacteria bacterium GW2011_GWA1_36_8]OGE16840.1 MAG: hypothetical protein A2858_02960 [Candidatus Daviesbacteria bacterium RIFCSPHIGHO2_01_FULL_36_37]OGE31198.1 MAG: hypothetical protein A3C99_00935 [Candidatus Daviesbacteria bacterium RIFCSPHIGHO2_02_F
MANGLRGQIADTAYETLEEIPAAVGKPVQDEVGKMIEVGVQAIQGQTTDPQKLAQQQEQAAKSKKDTELKRRKVQAWLNELNRQQTALNQQNLKKQQEKQAQSQEEKQKKEVKQFEVVQKRQNLIDENVRAKQAKAEIKRGVGG